MNVIVPQFDPRDPRGNHDQLCGVFLLPRKADVPVNRITLRSSAIESGEIAIEIGAGTHALALVALYFMTFTGTNQFWVTDEMRYALSQICGAWYANDSVPHPELQAVRLLRGDLEVHVTLDLKTGYRDHLAIERTPEELIRDAWDRRDTLASDTPEPFLRQALLADNSWMDAEWRHRAETLKNYLKRN